MPLRPGTPVRSSAIEYDPTQSGKEALSVDMHPSGAAARPHPPDSDPHTPEFPGCRHSPPAIDFHTRPSSKGQASTLRSETVDLPCSARVLPRILPGLWA